MGAESLQWSEEDTDKILSLLDGKTCRVDRALLRKEIAKIPASLDWAFLKTHSVSSRDQRSAFRKFGDKWLRLSPELKSMILERYDGNTHGFLGRAHMLEWLRDNLSEEWGTNDIERRAIRTVRFALMSFDSGMCSRVALNTRLSYVPELGSFGEDDPITLMANTAVLLGRKATPKDQQAVCVKIAESWRSA